MQITRACAVAVATVVLSSLGVAAPVSADPRPVEPVVSHVPVDVSALTSPQRHAEAAPRSAEEPTPGAQSAPGVAGVPPAPGAAAPSVSTGEVETDEFSLVGATWSPDSGEPRVEVRVRGEGGEWGQWQPLPELDSGPDAGTEEAANATEAASAPLWVGSSDAIEARVAAVSADAPPSDVELVLVDPGTSPADRLPATPAVTADAALGAPRIVRRAEWGADESKHCGSTSYNDTIKAVTVHHTAGPNSYSSVAAAMAQLRADYAYHTVTLGWCDLGYNFVVDKWGNVYEGRRGSVERAVVGAHAGGFNRDTLGISALGDYQQVGAPAAMKDAIARVAAWKLAEHHRDPRGRTTLVSAGGGTSRYPAGAAVALPTVFGHRDVGSTACPGVNLYAALDELRNKAATFVGAGLVNPEASASSFGAGGNVTLSAGLLVDQSWRLDILDVCSQRVIRTLTGSGNRGTGLRVSWDGRLPDGGYATPGGYRLQLSTSGGGVTAYPWATSVTLLGTPSSPATPPPTALPSGTTFVPLTPGRLHDTRDVGRRIGETERVDLPVLGRFGVPTTGVAAVALNVTATCATADTYLTVWPTGQSRPVASSLNIRPGETNAGLVLSGVGGGKVSIYNNRGSEHVVVDVLGYYATTGGSRYQSMEARRVTDSRQDWRGAYAPGEVREFSLTGLPGTSGAMSAAMLNVTVVNPSGDGYVSTFPAWQQPTGTSTVNAVPGRDVANRTVVKLTNNAFQVQNVGGSAHVVVDVVGWYSGAAGQTFTPVQPKRVLDSRNGQGGLSGAVGAGRTVTVGAAASGVPSNAKALVLTLTGDAPSSDTFVTAWQAGRAQPGTSDLNLVAGRTRANTVVVPVDSSQRVSLYNSRGSVHLVADVVGYYR